MDLEAYRVGLKINAAKNKVLNLAISKVSNNLYVEEVLFLQTAVPNWLWTQCTYFNIKLGLLYAYNLSVLLYGSSRCFFIVDVYWWEGGSDNGWVAYWEMVIIPSLVMSCRRIHKQRMAGERIHLQLCGVEQWRSANFLENPKSSWRASKRTKISDTCVWLKRIAIYSYLGASIPTLSLSSIAFFLSTYCSLLLVFMFFNSSGSLLDPQKKFFLKHHIVNLWMLCFCPTAKFKKILSLWMILNFKLLSLGRYLFFCKIISIKLIQELKLGLFCAVVTKLWSFHFVSKFWHFTLPDGCGRNLNKYSSFYSSVLEGYIIPSVVPSHTENVITNYDLRDLGLEGQTWRRIHYEYKWTLWR